MNWEETVKFDLEDGNKLPNLGELNKAVIEMLKAQAQTTGDIAFRAGEIEKIEKYEKALAGLRETCKYWEDLAPDLKQIGRREVVEFVVDEVFPLLDIASVSVHWKDKWNKQLKDWGI